MLQSVKRQILLNSDFISLELLTTDRNIFIRNFVVVLVDEKITEISNTISEYVYINVKIQDLNNEKSLAYILYNYKLELGAGLYFGTIYIPPNNKLILEVKNPFPSNSKYVSVYVSYSII